MLNGWQEVYSALTDFISGHPEVEIGASIVSIPENVRPEFYRLFNAMRTAFIQDKFPNLLNEGATLSQNYLKAEREVTELLGLHDVSVKAGLGRFLRDPINQLIRALFNPLFDLLRANVDIETFEGRASQKIEAFFGPLYLQGYEKWLALSLVKLLDADKSFSVIPREANRMEIDTMASTSLEDKEQVPIPTESRRLSFVHEPIVVFTVPDFIVHSAKLNRYFALNSEIGSAIANASNASKKREWYPLDSVLAIELGLTLIYVADNPEELSLVADAKKICRPDLIIECREQEDWYDKEGLEKAKLHYDSLKPRLGTYIVSKEAVPEQASNKLMPERLSKKPASEQEQKLTQEQGLEKQGADIHILTVGFDQSKLEPLISILMKKEDRGK